MEPEAEQDRFASVWVQVVCGRVYILAEENDTSTKY